YGDNLQALMVYLSNYQLVPLARTTEIIKNLIGKDITISPTRTVKRRIVSRHFYILTIALYSERSR
ncbi:MAG TPA: hypothetical protein VIK72_02330, partial [Clostridiaceae bacterium]